MKIIKKLVLSLFIALGISYATLWTCIWMDDPFYYTEKDKNIGGGWQWDDLEESTDFWDLIRKNTVEPWDSILNRTLKIFKLDNPERYSGPKKALAYAKYLINYALTFVAVIALCLLMYSFYCVVVGDEKQIDKAKWYLKWIAIAIVVMWLSWLITSLIFRLYDDIAKDETQTITSTQIFIINSIA